MQRPPLEADPGLHAIGLLALDPVESERAVRAALAAVAEACDARSVRLWVEPPEGSRDRVVCRWTPEVWSRRAVADLDLAPALREVGEGRPVEAGEELPALRALAEEESLDESLWLPLQEHGLLCLEGKLAALDDEELARLRTLAVLVAAALRRQRAETSLREARDQYRALTENATELFAELDAAGRFVYASPSHRDLLGYEPEQLLGTRSSLLLHPDDLVRAARTFQDSFDHASSPATGREGWSISLHRLLHADGSWRWFENSGRAFRNAVGEARFVTLGRDVTERIEMQADLERRQALERDIAELSSRIFALGGDQIESAVTEGLANAAAIAGADRGALWVAPPRSGDGWLSFDWSPDDLPPIGKPFFPWLARRIRAGETVQMATLDELPEEAAEERRHFARTGTRSMIAIPISFEGGVVGVIGFDSIRRSVRWPEADLRMLRLVGELLASALRRKQVEDALVASQSQLLQAQKMEAVGRLAGGIAHDFNNLLTVILGFSRAMLVGMEEQDPLREDVSEIHAAADRAAALTGQLLTFSRRQPLDVQGHDLNEVVRGLLPMLGRLLGDSHPVEARLHPAPLPVRVDAHQLEQVLLNLMTNARDAMPEGGAVEVATRLLPDEGAARLAVVDRGTGMDDETLAQVFDPFFTTKEQGKGTGLGLSIAYSIVEQFGGRLRFARNQPAGMRCEVTLPLQELEPAEESGPSSPRLPRAGAGATILLVEDQRAVRRLARRILEADGHHVLEAEDGLDALERLAELREEQDVDLLVSDIAMPGLGGPELATRLRADRPGLPVLFLSGFPDGPGISMDGTPSSGAFLAKPFDEEELLEAVRSRLAPS